MNHPTELRNFGFFKIIVMVRPFPIAPTMM